MFTTLMTEQHNTKIAVFGGKPGLKMEYKGRFLLEFYATSNADLQAWPETRFSIGRTSILRSKPLDLKMSVAMFLRIKFMVLTVTLY